MDQRFRTLSGVRSTMRKAATLTMGMAVVAAAMWPAYAQEAHFPKKTGVQRPGVQHDIAELTPLATIPVRGDPDWMALTEDGVWIASSSVNQVLFLDAATNRPGAMVTVANPCSGLVVDFGSLWIPSCGGHS